MKEFQADARALREAFERYRDRHPGESETVDRFVELLEYGEPAFHRDHPGGHFTASALVLDRSARFVLLTHHRKLDIWIQLGGHADGQADLLTAALREAEEESGVTSIEPVHAEIVDIDIHPIPAHGHEPPHEHYDVRYAFFADPGDRLVVSDESHDLAWVHIDDLDRYSTERSLRRAVEKAVAWVRHERARSTRA